MTRCTRLSGPAGAFLVAAVALAGAGAHAAPPNGLLDADAVGAAAMRRANPEHDGRGVVIAVLDTGVDMGVPGLERTTTDAVKVVEARDFTGESVVRCEPATRADGEDGHPIWRAGDAWVRGVDAIPGRPADAPVHLGVLDESRFAGAGVSDLDRDGRTDGRFAFVAFRDGEGAWRVAVDRDGNRDMAGEPAIRSYDRGHEHVTLFAGDPAKDLPRVSLAVHVAPGDDGPRQVEAHVVTASHGTHVAGIAAGHGMHGDPGRDGIAPGSQVLSLKIGNSTLAGGASVTGSMRRALEFAAKWGRDRGIPVVANMSYGIGSAREGENDLERFLERFAVENPHVLVVLSNGNEGPGLSSAGSPAAASTALSVGAALTPANASDLVGVRLARTEMFVFSGRGGEAAKPDVVAPGIASSTVPYWERTDVMRGTSMAAPAAAGVAALVLSAARANPGLDGWHAGLLKASLVEGARPLAGYGPLDQGAGMVDAGRALAAFKARLADPASRRIYDYRVEAPSSTVPGLGTGSFWRAGGWAPTADEPAEATVAVRFPAGTTPRQRADHRAAVALSSDASWLKVGRGGLALRGEDKGTFAFHVDPSGVARPGVHVATIRGRGPGRTGFALPVSVVTPHPAPPVDGVPTVRLADVRVGPAGLVRVPFTAPAGTRTMTLSVRPAQRAFADVVALLFDGRGHRVALGDGQVSSARGRTLDAVLGGRDLPAGAAGELVLYGVPASGLDARVDVEIRFLALEAAPIDRLSGAPGQALSARTEVVNRLGAPFSGTVRGTLRGVAQSLERPLPPSGLRHGFDLSPEFAAVELDLTLSDDDWNRFTDVAVNVLDRDGRAVVRTGFTNPRLTVRVDHPGKGDASFQLEVLGGRADANGPEARLGIAIRHLWATPVALAGTVAGDARVRIPPASTATVALRCERTPPAAPDGTAWFGEVDFVSRRDGAVWLRLPLWLPGGR